MPTPTVETAPPMPPIIWEYRHPEALIEFSDDRRSARAAKEGHVRFAVSTPVPLNSEVTIRVDESKHKDSDSIFVGVTLDGSSSISANCRAQAVHLFDGRLCQFSDASNSFLSEHMVAEFVQKVRVGGTISIRTVKSWGGAQNEVRILFAVQGDDAWKKAIFTVQGEVRIFVRFNFIEDAVSIIEAKPIPAASSSGGSSSGAAGRSFTLSKRSVNTVDLVQRKLEEPEPEILDPAAASAAAERAAAERAAADKARVERAAAAAAARAEKEAAEAAAEEAAAVAARKRRLAAETAAAEQAAEDARQRAAVEAAFAERLRVAELAEHQKLSVAASEIRFPEVSERSDEISSRQPSDFSSLQRTASEIAAAETGLPREEVRELLNAQLATEAEAQHQPPAAAASSAIALVGRYAIGERVLVKRSDGSESAAVVEEFDPAHDPPIYVLKLATGDMKRAREQDLRLDPSSWPSSVQAPPCRRTFTFGRGPLGLIFGDGDGFVLITHVEEGSQAGRLGVEVNSKVISVSGKLMEGVPRTAVLARVKQEMQRATQQQPMIMELEPEIVNNPAAAAGADDLAQLMMGAEDGHQTRWPMSLDPSSIEVYTKRFEAAHARAGGEPFLDEKCLHEAREAGMSDEDLNHIWRLVDGDSDDRLSLPEYLMYCTLVARCLGSGEPPPATLPAPIRTFAYSGRANKAAITLRAGTALPELSAAELAEGTGHFDKEQIIGQGGFGSVFRVGPGCLPSLKKHTGSFAVKRLDRGSLQGVQELQNEIEVLALCRHESLVPLLGFCLDTRALCLVYPLMEGGTLEQAITESFGCGRPLPWRARLRILRAACRALLYLHTPSSTKGVFLHRDIKPANILLDEHLNGRLADVGLLVMTNSKTDAASVHATNIKGTLGYLDPLYMNTGTYTVHTDAYAMGVTMLVALTGRAAQDAMRVATLENNVLEDPSQAPEVADPTAGWPTNDTTERLASIIQGIVCGTTLAKRMPFAKATTAIEDLADDANLRPGMAEEASVDEREAAGTLLKECVICMAAPRSVRFACGHMLCCEDCTEDLINAVAQTSWGAQNKCPSCRARIVVVARGGDMATQATFVGMQMSTARAPPSSVDTNAPPSNSAFNRSDALPSYSEVHAEFAPPSYTEVTQQVPRGGDASQHAGPSAEALAERALFRALSAAESSSTARSPRRLGEQPLIAGEVQKKGSGLLKSWSRRYAAVFESSKTMIYFNNQAEFTMSPPTSVGRSRRELAAVTPGQPGSTDLTLVLVSNEPIFIRLTSVAERDRWFDVLSKMLAPRTSL